MKYLISADQLMHFGWRLSMTMEILILLKVLRKKLKLKNSYKYVSFLYSLVVFPVTFLKTT